MREIHMAPNSAEELKAEKQRAAKAELRARVLGDALAFAASVIKSGEEWTPTCEEVIGGALRGDTYERTMTDEEVMASLIAAKEKAESELAAERTKHSVTWQERCALSDEVTARDAAIAALKQKARDSAEVFSLLVEVLRRRENRGLGQTTAIAGIARRTGALVITPIMSTAEWIRREFQVDAVSLQVGRHFLAGVNRPVLLDNFTVVNLLGKASNVLTEIGEEKEAKSCSAGS